MPKQLPVAFDPIRKQLFVENLALKLSPVDAAMAAGFTTNLASIAQALLSDEEVTVMVEQVRRERMRRYDVSKDRVLEDLVDAKEMARMQADPKSMVMALKEVSDVMGYHAPRQVAVDATVHQATTHQRLRHVSDAELIEMAEEGEFSVVELERAKEA